MVGIDIENIDRFKNLNNHLINRVYTKNEIDYCKKHLNEHIHFAGIWCAKEAVVKALNDVGLAVSEVEILHQDSGAPYVNITSKIKDCLAKKNMQNVFISISHTDSIATAIAVLR